MSNPHENTMQQTPCPLCRSQSLTRSIHFGDKREYRLCRNCCLIFVPPQYHVSADAEKSHYLKHENSLENEGYVRMFEKKIALIEKHAPGIRTVLDYGCGYAPVLKTLLTRKGYRATGYDPYFFPDTQTDDRFDCIVSTETFEHFKEPGKEIAKLVSKLAPGGTLAVMTRFHPLEKEETRIVEFEKWYYKRDPTHIVFYAGETFRWIARTHDLSLVFSDGVDFVIFKNNAAS